MREVHINFGEIAAVMEEQGWLNEYYLDFPLSGRYKRVATGMNPFRGYRLMRCITL